MDLSRPGSYLLVLCVPTPARVRVGALGSVSLAPGGLLYAGSAFGPGGLAGRLGHHLARSARPRWHVDYLWPATELVGAWWACGDRELEHAWARCLPALVGGALPRAGFGASDCGCAAHLVASAVPLGGAGLGPALARAAGGPVPEFSSAAELAAALGRRPGRADGPPPAAPEA